MSQWSWKETWTQHLQWKEKDKSRMTTKFFFSKKNREKTRWLTPTEFSASDETEEEEVKPVRAPHGLSDPTGDKQLDVSVDELGVRGFDHRQPFFRVV